MALRFRRTLKIAPGVRLNLTKTGVSTRVGPRGAGVTVGTSGTTVSAGLPGSGLHVSKKLPRRPKAAALKAEEASAAASQSTGKHLGFFGWIGVMTVAALVIWAIATLAT